ncbi:phage repressor protein CI [Edwardsiella tarda]|uniref:phage repressor protein CI n=1 Tax=Edwardsiella tarda TaxID=636 RepID=UPI0009BF1871|nr:phage repressor protein CI [Edwardsiella tarda]
MSTIKKISISESTKETRLVIESNKGGKEAIDRIMEAYGFSTKISLCNHLGVSQSTLANRYLRDTMPNDWVVICNLETGAKLEWLLTGKGPKFTSQNATKPSQFELTKIKNGKLENPIEVSLSSDLLPDHVSDAFFIKNDQSVFVIERAFNVINDGKWVVEIDDLVSIRELYRLPGGRLRVESGPSSFECQADDIKILGKVIGITEFIE